MARWSVRIGIGYGQFGRMVKPLFFEAAEHELRRKGLKCTNSALSLTSGLHKRDIAAFQEAQLDPKPDGTGPTIPPTAVDRLHPASQVMARWLALQWPRKIPLRGGTRSFDELVKTCQREGAPTLSNRLILQDLQRRGLVRRDDTHIEIINEDGLPDLDQEDSVLDFVWAVRDHMEACLSNLEGGKTPRYMEGSLKADELHSESVAVISSAARQWWQKAMPILHAQAAELSAQDKATGGDQRLRVGVYLNRPGFPRQT